MATVSSTKLCLVWYRVVQSGTPPPFIGGPWNDDTTADPDQLIGGVPFNTGLCLSEPIYLTGCGTGDAGLSMNFGLQETIEVSALLSNSAIT